MTPFAPDIRPRLPRSLHRGIGLIGAGGIVEYGHMPGYRKAGLNVMAIASRTPASAKRVAERWNIPHVFDDWRRLLDLPGLEIVDVSFPFDDERLEIVREAAARGKHILMEKPLAHSMDAARELVRVADQHNVLLAVNHNARWCPQHMAVRRAIEGGLLGDVYFLQHEMQNNQDSSPWFRDKWYSKQPRFQIMEYSVHHLDLMRFWSGLEPATVKATIARKSGQQSRGEMIASILLGFPNAAMGVVVDDNASHPQAPPLSRFRIEGTKGLVEGGGMGEVGFRIRSDALGEGVQSPTLEGAWFPDGFIGTMGELLCAIEDKREPSISARDNLKTLELVFKAYESASDEARSLQ